MNFAASLDRSPFVMPKLAINRLSWPSISEWRAFQGKRRRESRRTGANGRPPKCTQAELAALLPKDGATAREWRAAALAKFGIKKSAFHQRAMALILADVVKHEPCGVCGVRRYFLVGGAAV